MQRQSSRVLVAALLAALFSNSTALADIVELTLESYAPATLPTVSTLIDIPDPNDQLEVSRQAVLFALSPSGWDLGSTGGELHSLPTPGWSAWVWGIWNILPTLDEDINQKLGYELNEEAIAHPGPNGPEYFLWFHTDAWAERGAHNVGELPNNYGQIAGCTGGVWFQCPVPELGRFYIPEPATLSLLALGGLGLIVRRRCLRSASAIGG